MRDSFFPPTNFSTALACKLVVAPAGEHARPPQPTPPIVFVQSTPSDHPQTRPRTFMNKLWNRALLTYSGGTDAQDKAVNGRKADLYGGSCRGKKQNEDQGSVLRYS